MKFFVCLTAALIITTQSTWAQTKSPEGSLHAMADEETAVQELTALVKPHVFQLDRNLITFHYRDAKNKELHPQNVDELKNILNATAVQFWQAERLNSYQAGPGLYVAVDPTISRKHGGQMPQLFVVEMQKGTRIFNENLTDGARQLFHDLWSKWQCGDSPYPYGVTFNFRQGQTRSEFCRNLFIKVLRKLDVEAISYGYGGESLSGCRPDRKVALNVITRSAIDKARISFYSDQMRVNAVDSDFVSMAYNEGSSNQEFAVPKTLIGSRSTSDYLSWKEKYLYGCGPRWSFEAN